MVRVCHARAGSAMRTKVSGFRYNAAMTTVINDIADLVRILHERPDWLEAVRGIVVGEDLLRLPDEVAKFVEATNENFRLVHERLDRLEAGQAQTNQRLDSLEGRFDHLEGRFDHLEGRFDHLEGRFDRMERRFNRMEGRFSNFEGNEYERLSRRRILFNTVTLLGLSNPAIALTQDDQSTPELHGGVHRAIRSGRISLEQAGDLMEADLIIADDDGKHVLVESSITAANRDVERAARRAGTLAVALDATVVPVVATASIAEPQRALAEQQGVTVFIVNYRRRNPVEEEDLE